MFALNREIDKYKKSLENIRPKSSEPKITKIVTECRSARSVENLNVDIPKYEISENSDVSSCNVMSNGLFAKEEICEYNGHEESEEEHVQVHSDTPSVPSPIISGYLIDESYALNGIDVDYTQENSIESESETVPPCSSTQTEFRTELKPKAQIEYPNENFELIITPTIMVNIQDTIRSNLTHELDYSRLDFASKKTEYHRESKIAVNLHISNLIKKLSNEVVDAKSTINSYRNETTEGNEIIKQVFDKKAQDNYILLQRYFLRWVHYNTIEKLKRRNPAQNRLQKMEAFLQNITLERKRALNKLRRPGNLCVKQFDDHCRNLSQNYHMESPRLLIRTYNNK